MEEAAAATVEADMMVVAIVAVVSSSFFVFASLFPQPLQDYDNYGSSSAGIGGSSSRRNFQEYDAGDDDILPRRSNSISQHTSSPRASAPQRSSTLPTAPEPPKPKEPEIDLLGMDDDAFGSTVSAPTEKALPALGAQTLQVGKSTSKKLLVTVLTRLCADDDFDDFQSAPPSAAPTSNLSFLTASAPAPAAPTSFPPLLAAQPAAPLTPPAYQTQAGLFNMLSTNPTTAPARPMYASPPAVPAQNTLQNVLRPAVASPPPMGAPLIPSQGVRSPTSLPARASTTSPSATTQQQKPAASFDDLWSMSLGSASSGAGKSVAGAPQKSMKDLEKEKAQAQMWGGRKPPAGAAFGAFGSSTSTSNAAPSTSSGNGLDDLLF